MRQILDLTGHKYGRLRVLSFAGRDGSNKLRWLCRCDCGNETSVRGNSLRTGNTQSCGCYELEQIKKANFKHGHSQRSKTYNSWVSMKDRCYRETHKDYLLYGGRGITVCKRWRNSFLNFLEDMGIRPDGMTLDRIDSNGNYEPSNCRWSPPEIQNRNTSKNVNITHNRKTQCLKDWADELGLNYCTVVNRIHSRGKTPKQALGLAA